ncbi:PilZ domain-containing protein [Aquibacillus salsiterrae]|uniref:PilZ domain-containing protein n=1 Tax=Aquibacillus salsiterrae TaxID=2950439 RepID=A0A9X3WJG3_9BACI|nr:PilZ domain-containing protein [Aquibacillus salsiterrae]MDC3418186.1 PilZ domain-containing protein [Aquibacillus salsiterrae]
MIYILLMQLLIIVLMLVLLLKQYKNLVRLKNQPTSLNVEKLDASANSDNKRENFRVNVKNIACRITLKDFENSQLEKLRYRKFDGKVENISIGGLKLLSDCNLPVRQSIMIDIEFDIEDHPFCLNGFLIRKEEKYHRKEVSYGVKFTNLSEEEKQQLRLILNQMELQKRKIS